MDNLIRADFLKNFDQLLLVDVAEGRPTEDTLRTYYSQIQAWILWCDQKSVSVFDISPVHLRVWRSELVQSGYAAASIAQKLSIIRRFYQSAVDRKLILFNPASSLRSSKAYQEEQEENIKYLTLGQMELLMHIVSSDEAMGRDRAMIALMMLQGLRTIEIHRANVEDWDFEQGILYVKGKGHSGKIYPRNDVQLIILKYITNRGKVFSDNYGTPLFVATGNRWAGKRLSRHGIRAIIDFWLTKAGLKKAGLSCHGLRHTCGTQTYAATHDLRLVQEELRHKSPDQTAKYAHVINRMQRRATEEIPIKI